MEYVWLVVGFVLLIKGADFFVDGSSSLARLLRVPSVIIGLTIVAMGTSAPEASVSMSAALSGSNEIALSNVIGSNIFNGLVVVGICAFMAAFSTNKDILKRDLPLNILITFILCIMLANGVLSRLEGILLLIGMTAYLISMVISALKNRQDEENGKVLSLPKSLLYILGISAAITPLAVLSESVIDCILLLLSAILLYIFARSKKSMCRWEGAVCILLYIAYTGYLFVR